MNVSLTQELEQLVREKVESGLYYSASEVIREGLRLLRDRDEFKKLRSKEIRDRIARGIDQLDRGEGVDGEEFFEQLHHRGEELKSKKT